MAVPLLAYSRIGAFNFSNNVGFKYKRRGAAGKITSTVETSPSELISFIKTHESPIT